MALNFGNSSACGIVMKTFGGSGLRWKPVPTTLSVSLSSAGNLVSSIPSVSFVDK